MTIKPTTKLETTEEVENWFEANEFTRRENIIAQIRNHDYIKNTLDLVNLENIKLTFALAEELERLVMNKATIAIMRILMDLGVQKLKDIECHTDRGIQFNGSQKPNEIRPTNIPF